MNKPMAKKLSKSIKTKDLILNTAISMFQKHGYETTTMRGIAAECDVSLGNAYYYFQSKEQLVLGLYETTLERQTEVCREALKSHKTIKKRLAEVLYAQIKTLKPYRVILRSLFKFGADPSSPLNPFSSDSLNIRQGAIEIFDQLVASSQEKLSADIQTVLPYYLWLYSMGIIFFWLHDSTIEQTKTAKLIDLTADLISKFVSVISLPVLKPFRSTLIKLMNEFRLKEESIEKI